MVAARKSASNSLAWTLRRRLASAALGAALLASGSAGAQTPTRTELAADYAVGGVGVCVECHDETEDHPVYSIFKTKHATMADPSAPLAAGHACQSCHGPSAAHVEDNDRPTAVRFSANRPVEAQNKACLQCHEGAARMNWSSAVHESRGLACVDCHDIHTAEDPVLRENLKPGRWVRDNTQSEVCFTCHAEKRAQIQRVSSHPLRDGKMRCSDCHNTHGTAGESNLQKLTVNETCYECHAEKRGPFLWEHAPVREDCTICHTPHGSNYPALLNARQPFQCQQCHMAQFHPSGMYTGRGIIAEGGAAQQQLEKSCTNCHVEVHGSNHPSGVRWLR